MAQQGKLLKEQKYDRQLRLWGDHGQEALESAHVCLINATATGTEILKNLVLPGIGSFTIIDGNQVSGEDVGNKYVLQMLCFSKNRAQAAMEFLQELNSDVSGSFVEESPENLLDNDPSFFCRFTIVVATQLLESTLLRLADVLWNSQIPLLICRTYGLVGYMRIIIKEHTVIESHPDNALEDLRLDKPFPELREHFQSYDLEHMDKKVGGLRILKSENGAPEDEENFEEAIKNVNTALNITQVPSSIEDIFNDDRCINITKQTPSFWILARALKEFVAKEGQGNLPVRGTIPDMIADSSKYIKLQNVYREKAKKDAAAVGNHVANLLQSVGQAPESISEKELKLFCNNSAFLRVVRCRSLAEEYGLDTVNKDEIISSMDNPDSEIVLYLMLRAVDRFHKQHGRYPGVSNYQVEEDIGKLKSCLTGFLQEYGLSVMVKDDYVHEFCRYGAAEPHTIAAFLGGAAAQEVIKVITKQFVIFNNTYIYSAHVQNCFVSSGGLDVLSQVLVQLELDSHNTFSSAKLAVMVTKTLDACITNNSSFSVVLSKYHIVSKLLSLLLHESLDLGEKFSIILAIGHCTEDCEENQYEFLKSNGFPLMIQALTEFKNEELSRAATYVLHNCKKISCVAVRKLLNSRNFSKLLQSCTYQCDYHKVIMEAEDKYKSELRKALICDKGKRRIRKNFTKEEVNYLFHGVKKMGNHWNSILWSFPFQQGRKAVDLAHKYYKLIRGPNCAAI
ncbi:NEDD8-activating enzyme E1 regulatory subunit [Microtus ochrogaster]|uniref:NEDD8-activating enzyme E1 regulatory subunit n=1 Tax=Microtus ochrogaster TaxID=79684 RepID=A0A8J6G0J7_MICOH|nr:NEDD8-activating enzyme E1 regulatory subunit [Microtus ochrogaster]